MVSSALDELIGCISVSDFFKRFGKQIIGASCMMFSDVFTDLIAGI